MVLSLLILTSKAPALIQNPMQLFQPATLNRLFKRIKALNTSGEIRHLSVAEEAGPGRPEEMRRDLGASG